ncbi:LacI family DNA-binding transcriptional regulator, partial [Streptomyces prunicolor]|uniref:LacI family DNA-binding transcriptional regulator n=1 Tax=Streptomyces prunicolor TaxID=67348 RepID=UPI0033F846FE
MDVTGHTSFGGHGDPPQGPQKAASIRDVAAAAGVSYQTVSRVINGLKQDGKWTDSYQQTVGSGSDKTT